MTKKYDLLLKNGEVIDPSQSLRGARDVAFRDGRVAALDSDISSEDAREVVDVTGRIVTPGLIDIHGHYFQHIVPFATSADEVYLPNGVTTTVDAGSSGWLHFEGFKEFILTREQTRLMALVNLSALGMMSPPGVLERTSVQQSASVGDHRRCSIPETWANCKTSVTRGSRKPCSASETIPTSSLE